MTGEQTKPPASPARGGKGALITGAVLLAVGIVAIVLGIVVVGGTTKELSGTQIGAPQTAPATFTSPLKAFTAYGVYASDADGGKVQPSDITVTDSKGNPITVNKSVANATAVSGGKTFTEAAIFDTGTSDTFTIKVATSGAVVAVAPSVSTVSQGFAWFAAVILGGLLALVGIILLVLGLVQRATSSKS